MTARFPFPSFPRGWYVVGFSSDVLPGQVKTVHYFAQDIVLFRTEAGVLSALDKTCPHLGAHLGGGCVEGEKLRCPFHGWAFGPDGGCTDVPYAPKIPPRARVRAWPLCEQNGTIFVYFCPKEEPPQWQVPLLEEEDWTANRTIRWEVRTHPQEVCENTVDCAHLTPVHHVTTTEVLSVEQAEHYMRVVLRLVATGAAIQMPDEINEVELDVRLHGLGQVISRTHVLTAGLRARQRIHPTPIDAERIAIFAIANTRHMPDPEYTREIDEIFWNAFVEDFARDFPIWENKAYLDRPLLAGGDGPIGRYRRWARQFYVEPGQPAQAAQSQADGPDQAHAVATPFGALYKLTGWLRRLGRSEDAATASDDSTYLDPGDDRPDTPATPRKAETKKASAAPAFDSVDSYFHGLEARFDERAAGDLDAVFQWVLTGEGARAHFAEIRHNKIHAASGLHPAPTITIEMSASDYLLMINGKLNGAHAFSTGRGKLRGPLRLAMKMQKLFPLDRQIGRPASHSGGSSLGAS